MKVILFSMVCVVSIAAGTRNPFQLTAAKVEEGNVQLYHLLTQAQLSPEMPPTPLNTPNNSPVFSPVDSPTISPTVSPAVSPTVSPARILQDDAQQNADQETDALEQDPVMLVAAVLVFCFYLMN